MSARDHWETPQHFFDLLNDAFCFDIDVAANRDNRKCEEYFGPDHADPERRNALAINWAPFRCWLNPPYSDVTPWLKKAYAESVEGALVVTLVRLDTSTDWWRDWAMKANKIIYLVGGRIQFEPPRGVRPSSNNGSNVLLVYDGAHHPEGPESFYWDFKNSLETGELPNFLKGIAPRLPASKLVAIRQPGVEQRRAVLG